MYSIKKQFILFFALNILFSLSSFSVLASVFPSGDEIARDGMNEVMTSLGVDRAELKKTVQTMNVARQKKTPPQAALTFTPSSPVPGMKIVASTNATYFINDPGVLYYTWYLKHHTGKAASEDSEGRKTKDGNTDWNEDGEIDIEDYKIEAMRIIANGGFDWQRAMGEDAPACVDYPDYCKDSNQSSILKTQDSDGDKTVFSGEGQRMRKDALACVDQSYPDYCKDPNQYDEKVTTTADDDGYKPVFGGEDQKGKNSHCYVNNIATGNLVEIKCGHLFPNAPDEKTGDNKFSLKEEAFWRTNPNSKDTSNGGTVDEAAVSGLGKNMFAWNYMTGDKVGVAVEGASVESTDYADSSYKITWAISGNPEIKASSKTSSSSRPDAGSLVYRFSQLGDYYCGYTDKGTTGVDFHDPNNGDDDSVIEPRATVADANAQCTVSLSCGETRTFTHPGLASMRNDYSDNYVSGDLNTPYSYFRWKSFGDRGKLAIIIDKSYPDNCKVCVDGECGNLMGRIGGAEETYTIADINAAIETDDAGFVEPSEGTAGQKMEVSLSYQPETPMNSESADAAEQLIVQSSIMGVENKSFLNYAWQVYLSSDMAAEDSAWKMLTLADLEEQTGLKKLSGIGLASLKMNLNFKDDILSALKLKENQKTFYAKVVLRAVEGTAEKKRDGVGTIIIPIQLADNTLKVFSANVSDNLAPVLVDSANGSDSLDAERCDSGPSLAICPVVKNEIIGIKLDLEKPDNYDFLWSFDNMPVTKTEKNIAYIPILGERDSQHILSLTALDKVTGEKISLIRTFEVVDPTISLSSTDTDTCAPTLLGYYIDPINANPNPATGMDASAWPDLSLDKFEALSGEIVKIKPTFNTTISGDNAAWFFDGVQITTANMSALGITEIKDDGTLVFTANKAVGEKYEITLGALYTQPNLVKKALYEIWEVPQTNFYEKLISQTIEIKVTDNLSSSGVVAQTKNPQQKILASLFSAIPSYITFLFRAVLTMLLILFLIHTLFSLFPEQKQV